MVWEFQIRVAPFLRILKHAHGLNSVCSYFDDLQRLSFCYVPQKNRSNFFVGCQKFSRFISSPDNVCHVLNLLFKLSSDEALFFCHSLESNHVHRSIGKGNN
jgi:hypothetical protein